MNTRLCKTIVLSALTLFSATALAGTGSRLAHAQKAAVTAVSRAQEKIDNCRNDTACRERVSKELKEARARLQQVKEQAKKLAQAARAEYQQTCAQIQCTQPY